MENDTPTVTGEQAPPTPNRGRGKAKNDVDVKEITMNHNEEACCQFTGITANKSSEKVLFREGSILISAEAIDVLTNQLAQHRAQRRGN